MSLIEELASQVNVLSRGHAIGDLQQLRARLRGTTRMPTQEIFDGRTTRESYAFHVGGRKEIQFNIGEDQVDGVPVIRYGLGFSLEPSQSLPSVDVLFPKIRRFNDYVSNYRNDLAHLSMWHYASGLRSQNYSPTEIPSRLARADLPPFLGPPVTS